MDYIVNKEKPDHFHLLAFLELRISSLMQFTFFKFTFNLLGFTQNYFSAN